MALGCVNDNCKAHDAMQSCVSTPQASRECKKPEKVVMCAGWRVEQMLFVDRWPYLHKLVTLTMTLAWSLEDQYPSLHSYL